ncbi:MAG: UMP kinase [Deltaproteobacteria bacterium]|nr:UMP kinase [Deltaproteobacteria bacterium]RLA88002.1 MAG: UMP kinase [Deltaproteobacteria bacterium]
MRKRIKNPKRILLKLSGEIIGGEAKKSLSFNNISWIANEIIEIADQVEVAMVVGGGNIIRGTESNDVDRVTADQMGMLATIINGLALRDAIKAKDGKARLFIPGNITGIGSSYSPEVVKDYLKAGEIVILAGGTGNPFFSTDTAAVLRGAEIKAELVMKATKVEGVFDADPAISPNAKMFKYLTYQEVIERDLRFMDATALILAKEINLPIAVFNFQKQGNLKRIINGEEIGTWIN